MNRTELQRERDKLERDNEGATNGIALRQKRIAAIDAQLARPALPEGWTAADMPPSKFKCVIIVDGADALKDDPADGRWAMAFHDGTEWCWPGAWDCAFKGCVFAWREIPADWLATPAKYPRYFRHRVTIGNNIAYVRFDGDGAGYCIRFDGSEHRPCNWDEDEADSFVRNGVWLEITAAEAEAMVKPAVKECLTTEPTTERLVKLATCAGYDRTRAEQDEIVRRIRAADRSGLCGLWEEPSERHNVAGKAWLVQPRSPFEGGNLGFGWYTPKDNAWLVTFCDEPDPVLVDDRDILALADPSRLIGGGS